VVAREDVCAQQKQQQQQHEVQDAHSSAWPITDKLMLFVAYKMRTRRAASWNMMLCMYNACRVGTVPSCRDLITAGRIQTHVPGCQKLSNLAFWLPASYAKTAEPASLLLPWCPRTCNSVCKSQVKNFLQDGVSRLLLSVTDASYSASSRWPCYFNMQR
jgi:hypothetical protein